MPSELPAGLGAFLRASRDRTSPEQTGLPTGGSRRVSGLRREEVAALAGISQDYYVRLEQGRDERPSVQVIDALARVFGFDRDARQHAYRLAGLMPSIDLPPTNHAAAPELQALLDLWPDTPAIVFDHAYDMLAQNRLGRALFSPFDPSTNLVVSVFLDPAARSFYADWDSAARNSAGALRLASGRVPGDHRIAEVVAMLTRLSPEFSTLWSDPRVSGKTSELKQLHHPLVGPLDLTMQTFDVRSAPAQQLIVYHPAPESVTAERLRLLGSLAVTT
jgi:transcriptional regulator with XRE-family HTH domain